MKNAKIREIKKAKKGTGKKVARIITSLLLPPVETIVLIVEAVKEDKEARMATPPDINVDEIVNKNETTETSSAEEEISDKEGS